MPNLKNVTCAHCGKELQIPEDLTEFSCLYCGERTKIAPEALPVPEGDWAAEDRWLRENLLTCISRYPEHYKKLAKRDFFPAFEAYEAENAELCRRLDLYIRLHPQGIRAGIQEMCVLLLDGIAVLQEKAGRMERGTMMFNTKLVLAIFFTPLFKKLQYPTAEQFTQTLNELWLKRWPKEAWPPGTYDMMAEGYNKRRWCFITTATCRSEGKPDDCPELTAFRRFRDGWLQTQPQGSALIARYYDIAPGIVCCIDHCDDPAVRYGEIRSRWLTPCYEDLCQGRMEACMARYADMVCTLEKTYHLS